MTITHPIADSIIFLHGPCKELDHNEDNILQTVLKL